MARTPTTYGLALCDVVVLFGARGLDDWLAFCFGRLDCLDGNGFL